MIKLRKIGLNIIIASDNQLKTITVPKDYNTDILFTLVGKIHSDIKVAEKLFWKEVAKFEKPVVKDLSVLEARINRKKINKEIKKIQSINIDELPIVMTPEWQEVLSSQEDTSHIENMLVWLSLNDKSDVRENFLSQFSSKFPYITPNGLLVSVRNVWKNIEESTDVLYNFIRSEYFKKKGQKKGTKNYSVVENSGNYLLVKEDAEWNSNNRLIGNLDHLFHNYPKPDNEVTYYSNYAKNHFDYKENWKLGEIVTVTEKAQHTNWCDSGQLHIRLDPNDTKNNGYGDTTVIVLVNVKDITNIAYDWKYCTSRMMIVAEIEEKDISEFFVQDFGKFDVDFIKEDMKQLKADSTKQWIKQNKLTKKRNIDKLKSSISYLNKPLQNDSSHLSKELYDQILKNRINLI